MHTTSQTSSSSSRFREASPDHLIGNGGSTTPSGLEQLEALAGLSEVVSFSPYKCVLVDILIHVSLFSACCFDRSTGLWCSTTTARTTKRILHVSVGLPPHVSLTLFLILHNRSQLSAAQREIRAFSAALRNDSASSSVPLHLAAVALQNGNGYHRHENNYFADHSQDEDDDDEYDVEYETETTGSEQHDIAPPPPPPSAAR